MGKISPVSSKYIIHSTIEIEGIVERPDVIGAIFGQTEGLLGADLELRELQRSGRIGRIEVNVDTKSGKTRGTILIPSSLDKAETAIVGATLEIIERIGPCNAHIRVTKIEDVRVSKRQTVINRAKILLKDLTEKTMPDSQELADEVAHSVRVMEIQSYGKEKLPCGPAVEDSDEIIVVEGRADVLNLLKYGIKNVIGMNGTSCPYTIKDLSKRKTVTVFTDGDRGGDLIIKELLGVAELDFVTKAPDGKEVEEITQKEILKALRGKITAEQAKLEMGRSSEKSYSNNYSSSNNRQRNSQNNRPQQKRYSKPAVKKSISADEKSKFKSMLEDLIGTKGAYILDDSLNILGKVPLSELEATIKSLKSGISAVVLDGVIDKSLVEIAEKIRIKRLIAMDTKVNDSGTRIQLLVSKDL